MDLCICWWCYIYFLQEVPVSCQNQEQLHHFCTLPVSAAPKWFTCYLRDVTPDNFVVSHLFYVFYLSFLCAHTPLPCPVTLLSVLPLSAHTSILCSSSSHSQFLSLILSPFAPSAWPIRITRSHKHSSSCFLLCSLVSPFFPFSSLLLSGMYCLSCCTTEILFLFSFISGSISGSYYRHIHFTSEHCCPAPLNSSYSMFLCYFPGRNVCPGAVYQRWMWRWFVQVHVRCVGPPMHTQMKCRANKPWAFPVPKGLGRAFWLIYDHFDDWGDSQKECEYVLNMENLARMPLAFKARETYPVMGFWVQL